MDWHTPGTFRDDNRAIANSRKDSAFESIRQHSNCTCSFCWAIWQTIDNEKMTEMNWLAYQDHLKTKHGWVQGEAEEFCHNPAHKSAGVGQD